MSNEPAIKNPRLWIVTELYYPEETSTGYYLTRIAEGLADGRDVKVLCGQPTYSARGIVAAKHEVHIALRPGMEDREPIAAFVSAIPWSVQGPDAINP